MIDIMKMLFSLAYVSFMPFYAETLTGWAVCFLVPLVVYPLFGWILIRDRRAAA